MASFHFWVYLIIPKHLMPKFAMCCVVVLFSFFCLQNKNLIRNVLLFALQTPIKVILEILLQAQCPKNT